MTLSGEAALGADFVPGGDLHGRIGGSSINSVSMARVEAGSIAWTLTTTASATAQAGPRRLQDAVRAAGMIRAGHEHGHVQFLGLGVDALVVRGQDHSCDERAAHGAGERARTWGSR